MKSINSMYVDTQVERIVPSLQCPFGIDVRCKNLSISSRDIAHSPFAQQKTSGSPSGLVGGRESMNGEAGETALRRRAGNVSTEKCERAPLQLLIHGVPPDVAEVFGYNQS